MIPLDVWETFQTEGAKFAGVPSEPIRCSRSGLFYNGINRFFTHTKENFAVLEHEPR